MSGSDWQERAHTAFKGRFEEGWSFVLGLFAVLLPAATFAAYTVRGSIAGNVDAIQLVQPAYQSVTALGLLGAMGLALSGARHDEGHPRTVAEFLGEFLGHWAFLAAHAVAGVALVVFGFAIFLARDVGAALPTLLGALLLGALGLGIWCATMQAVMAIGASLRGRMVGAVFTAFLFAQLGSNLGAIPFMRAFAASTNTLPLDPGTQLLLVLSVLSPGGALAGLLEMTVAPATGLVVYPDAFPLLHTAWFYTLATLLWFAVPLSVGAWRIRKRAPGAPEEWHPSPESSDQEPFS